MSYDIIKELERSREDLSRLKPCTQGTCGGNLMIKGTVCIWDGPGSSFDHEVFLTREEASEVCAVLHRVLEAKYKETARYHVTGLEKFLETIKKHVEE